MAHVDGERGIWIGCAVAVGATVVLTTIAAALESSVNGPGDRTVAGPVLWAFGGGLGLCIGACVTAWLTRRVGPGILAACVGAVPFLVLIIVAYNDESLRFEDQLVGSLVIVVLPGLVAAVLCSFAVAHAARAFARHARPASPDRQASQANQATQVRQASPARKSVIT